MKKIIFIAIFALFASTLFVSCPLLGSGRIVTETRKLNGTFRNILAGGGPINVILEEGLGDTVKVSADDNLIALIDTSISEGNLYINMHSKLLIEPTRPVTIRAPFREDISSIEFGGVGSLKSEEKIIGEDFSVSVDHWGSVSLDISGITDTVKARVFGSGDITLKLGNPRLLNAEVLRSGIIRYSGTPASVSKNVPGSGKIEEIQQEEL